MTATVSVISSLSGTRWLPAGSGQDADATRQARGYFTGYAPSSPQIAMFKDGRIVFMLERFQIEGRSADAIAADMAAAFDKYCAKEATTV